jgi:hemerythrin
MYTEAITYNAADLSHLFPYQDTKQYDSRYANLLGRIDTIINQASHNPASSLSGLVVELLDTTLNQTISEEAHMISIQYRGYIYHFQDHYRLNRATVTLRTKAEQGLCTVLDLQTLRDQWTQHIQCFDNALERYLIENQAPVWRGDKE